MGISLKEIIFLEESMSDARSRTKPGEHCEAGTMFLAFTIDPYHIVESLHIVGPLKISDKQMPLWDITIPGWLVYKSKEHILD